MAKINFSKLSLTKDNSIKTINFNGVDIEVKQYLPVQEKLDIITDTINAAADNNKFTNKFKLSLFLSLQMVYSYTNISFTDKQKENAGELYDKIKSSKLLDAIFEAIPEEEYTILYNGVIDLSNAIYAQMNSAVGILETINTDYSNLNLDLDTLNEKISNPENLKLVKDVLTKLG